MFWQQSCSALHSFPLLLAQTSNDETLHEMPETARWWYQYLRDAGIGQDWVTPVVVVVIALLGLVLPFLLAGLVARSLRMRDYGFKLGLVFCSLAMAAVIIAVTWPPKLGIDLKGGVILIYEITGVEPGTTSEETEQGGIADIDTGALIEAIKRRINPSGLKEVVVRPYGENQVEIIIPEVDDAEVENIKRNVATAGFLRFRIVADRIKHEDIIALAEEQKESREVEEQYQDQNGKTRRHVVGYWARVGRDEKPGPNGLRALKVDVRGDVIRDAETKEWITNIPPSVMSAEQPLAFEKWLADNGIKEVDVLMAVNPNPDSHVQGRHVASVMRDIDNTLNPQVSFTMTTEGGILMGQLTGNNLPEGQRYFDLGIILDDTLLSAPRIQSTITDRGRITGNFTEAEVDFLVNILQAGKLPATLNKTPISESQIDPLLGVATIRQGTYAIGISLVAVLLFMLVYYRFAGIVACLALMANLVLILGVMMLVRAAFTLPGLAGLVLTVGMSVDANVLIFERIREELNRGSALRMAIRNGFARATTTIVDANLTTLITAIVLYAIGTDQVRGFAVTLILGILMSMYTAIFCSRVIFDIGERKRWISKLGMMSIVGSTHFDFIGKRRIAIGASIVVILIGLVAVFLRGRNIFDIDFNGGSSVQVTLSKPVSDATMRSKLSDVFENAQQWEQVRQQINDQAVEQLKAMDVEALGKVAEQLKLKEELTPAKLADMSDEKLLQLALHAKYGEDFESPTGKQDYTVNGLPREGKPADTAYMVVTSIQSAEYLKDVMRIALREGEGTLLESYRMSYEPLVAKVNTSTAPAGGGEQNAGGAADGADAPSGGSFPPSGALPGDPRASEPATDGSNDSEGSNSSDGAQPDNGDGAGRRLPSGESFVLFQNDGPALEGPEDEKSPSEATPEKASEAKAEKPDETNVEKPGESSTSAAPAEGKPTEEKPVGEKPATGDAAPKPAAPAAEPSAPESGSTESGKDGQQPKEADTPESEPPAPTDETPKTPSTETPPTEPPSSETPSTETAPSTGPTGLTPAEMARAEASQDLTETTVKFAEHKVNAATLSAKIDEIGQELFQRDLNPELLPRGEGAENWTLESNLGFLEWRVTLEANEAETKQVLDRIQQEFANTAVWTSSSKIGGQVARDTQGYAIMALLVSLAGIVGYIWWRFQKVVFGLAAVVALVHDVLVTLGAIAISYWLASSLGFLGIDQFKISLPVVAALLTIIGYSLNDTIVVFDRIREVRGKSPDLTAEMINTSINQTLSRTLLTSLTTFLVVVILYFIGGPGIHAFAFCLVVGVLVGTYSSIYIASPFLLWMAGAKSSRRSAV